MCVSPYVRLDAVRLLVVEDDEFAVRVYRRTLLRHGVTIVHAASAASALEALTSDPNFDAIILDLSLPGGIGGADLLAELDRQNIELPVIVITASADLKSARELMPYRVASYHVKSSSTFESLIDIVKAAVELHESQRRLTAFERHLHTIVNTAPWGIALFDPDEQSFVEMNPALENVLGTLADDRSAATGQSNVVAFGDALLKASHHSPTRIDLPCGDTYRRIEFVAIPLERGGHRFLVAHVRDVSDDERARELERALVRAQKMEALGLLAAGIAHDFNNTMMAALPWAELLLKQAHDDTVARAATHIREALRRAKDVTRGIMDFAQPRTATVERVCLKQLVEEQVRLLRAVVPSAIQLQTKTDDSIFIGAPAGQIAQVITNLVLNSRDAITGTGTIEVVARIATPTEAHNAQLAGTLAALEVRDSGRGIPSEARRRIFEPFFTTKHVGHGNGLGLSMVLQITSDLQGAVLVDSEEGAGTRVLVLLPCLSDDSAAVGSATEPPSVALHMKSILIVDDEPLVREGMRFAFEDDGITVAVAGNGGETLSLFETGYVPELMILDFGLPDMTGLEVLDHVRRRFPNLPVVLATGYAAGSAILDAVKSDEAVAYLQKPYEFSDLLGAIDRLTVA